MLPALGISLQCQTPCACRQAVIPKNPHMNRTITKILLASAVALLTCAGAHAASITWGSATTVAGDSDVSTIGAFKYAEHWGGSVTTINGVTFSAAGTNVVASGSPVSIQPSSVGSPAGMSTAYQGILSWNWYNAQNKTATLNNLTSGHQYQSQVWVADIRYSTTQKTTITGGPNLLIKQGQYANGTFVADATSQSIAFTGDGIVNAIQVRDVSASWSGTTNGTWADSDTTSSNFSGLNFTAAKAQSTVAVFGDTTTAGGSVSNFNLTVGVGGASTGTVIFENTTAQAYTLSSADSTGITGTTAVTKTGNGQVTLNGANTYNGTTTISGGTLSANATNALGGTTTVTVTGGSLLVMSSNALNTSANVVMNGGNLTMAIATAGGNQTLGALTLSANSTLDFSSSSANTLRFSGIISPGNNVFNITNWTPGSDHLYFTSNSTLSATNFTFDGLANSAFVENVGANGWEIIAIPEPATILAGAMLLGGMLFAERKRLSVFFAAHER